MKSFMGWYKMFLCFCAGIRGVLVIEGGLGVVFARELMVMKGFVTISDELEYEYHSNL